MKALLFIVSFCIVTVASASQTNTECQAMIDSRDVPKKEFNQKSLVKKQMTRKQ